MGEKRERELFYGWLSALYMAYNHCLCNTILKARLREAIITYHLQRGSTVAIMYKTERERLQH